MSLSQVERKQLRSFSRVLQPYLRIGKKGVTKEACDEIKNVLKRKGIVKIKLMRGALLEQPREKLVELLATQTGAIVVDQVGFTTTLYQPRYPLTRIRM